MATHEDTSPFTHARQSIGHLGLVLTHNLGDWFLRTFLTYRDRAALLRVSRGLQLVLYVDQRAASDELVFLSTLVPRFRINMLCLPVTVALNAVIATTIAMKQTKHGVGSSGPMRAIPSFLDVGTSVSQRILRPPLTLDVPEDERLYTMPTQVTYKPQEPQSRLFVVSARLHPAPVVMPVGARFDTNVYTMNLRAATVVGVLDYAPSPSRLWKFDTLKHARAFDAWCASDVWIDQERQVLIDDAASKDGGIMRAPLHVHVQLGGGMRLDAILADQMRSTFDYTAALRAIRNDMNLEQHLIDSGALAIDGVFVVLERLYVTIPDSPMHNLSPLIVAYVGRPAHQVVHGIH